MSDAERIEELRTLIARYKDAYYQRDESLVSDKEYDELEKELRKLEKLHPEYQADSPAEKVGSSASNLFAPHQHLERMLSLDNAFSEEEFQAWSEELEADHFCVNQRLMA